MKKNLKILIADDSELMQLVMRGFFTKHLANASLKQTSNLNDTYFELSQQDFDLLLLDINMPNGDSTPQTVIDIKSKYPDLKVVMFSGNDRATLEESYLDAGAIGFIQKDERMSVCAKEIIDKHFS